MTARLSLLACGLLLAAALLLLAVPHPAHAACPSNGNTHSMYVTLNNRGDIMSLDSSGRFVGGVINFTTVPSHIHLEKLRAITFGIDGNLYVSSALSELSRIIVLSGKVNTDCTRDYLRTFQLIDKKTNPLMDHPYDVKFMVDQKHGRSVMFVANQNSVTVTRYCGPRNTVGKKLDVIAKKERLLEQDQQNNKKKSTSDMSPTEEELEKMNTCEYGEPLEPSHYLATSSPDTAPRPGEFVTTHNHNYHIRSVRGMAVYQPRYFGEERKNKNKKKDDDDKKHRDTVSIDDYQLRSRDRALKDENRDGPLLLVCDVDGSELIVVSAVTGAFLWSYHHRIPFPVQVMIPEKQFGRSSIDHPYFYATSKSQGVVYKGELARGAYVTPLLSNQGFQYSSGIVEVPSHETLYIADRGSNQIVLFGVADTGNEAITERLGLFGKHVDLGDHPEHMAYVRLADPAELPFCYELGHNGLKRAPLCSAVMLCFWAIVAAVAFYFARKTFIAFHAPSPSKGHY